VAASLAAACGDDSTGPDLDPAPVADTVQLPDTLFDGHGYIWDVFEMGTIGNGTSDAYDGGMTLSVGGTSFTDSAPAVMFPDVPEVWIGPDTLAGLVVTRRVYVSPTRNFARFVEIFENRGAGPVATSVVIGTNLGSDASTVLVSTSDGDATFETTDRWIVTDDADASGDPTLLHVLQGPGAPIAPQAVAAPTGTLQYTFALAVAAGQRVILMHFASQNEDRDDALRNAVAMASLGASGMLDELTDDDLEDVVNWDLAP